MLDSKIKIAIAGVGTVGKGLIDLLLKHNNKQSKLEISAIASRKKQEFKGAIFKNTVFFDDAKELLTSMYWALNIIEIRHLIHYCMTIGNHDMIDAMMVEEAKEYFSRNPIKEDIQYDSCYTIAMLDEKNNHYALARCKNM